MSSSIKTKMTVVDCKNDAHRDCCYYLFNTPTGKFSRENRNTYSLCVIQMIFVAIIQKYTRHVDTL